MTRSRASAKAAGTRFERSIADCLAEHVDDRIDRRVKTGMSYSSEYRSWHHMKLRCTSPNATGYENYGGRGIEICPEWVDDFSAFYAHIGPKPGPNYSIDRIDNDGHYEPGNVRWATRAEQRANQRPRTRVEECKNGHAYTAGNTYLPPGGTYKSCRTCKREAGIRSEKRRTEARRAARLERKKSGAVR